MSTSQEVEKGWTEQILDFRVRDLLSAIGRWFARLGYWALFGLLSLGGFVMVFVDLVWVKSDGMILAGYLVWMLGGQFLTIWIHGYPPVKTWRSIATG